jgi:hypothetical protein
LLALFSPLLDPARLSVDSQMARLASGQVAPEKFDFGYLRFGETRYGSEALARLHTQTSGPQAAAIRAGAARALSFTNRWEMSRGPVLTPSARLANLTVWPSGAALPPDMLAFDPGQTFGYVLPPCLREASARCDAFIIDFAGSGKPDVMVVGSARGGGAVVRHQGSDQKWAVAEILPARLAGCEWFRSRMIAGQFRTVTPARKALEVGGQVFQANPVVDQDIKACPLADPRSGAPATGALN